MLGRSFHEYVFIRVSIGFLRLVAPLCAVYVLVSLYDRVNLLTPLGVYAIAELLFYVAVFLPRLQELQKTPEDIPSLTPEQRRALFDKCVVCMTDGATNGWFLRSDHSSASNLRVRRENVVDWLLWALFSSAQSESTDEWEEELDYYVSFFGTFLGYDIDRGRNPDIRTMRLSQDPVRAIHRPLVWYMIIALVDFLTSLSLIQMGFRHYDSSNRFRTFPPRPLLWFYSTTSPAPTDIPYWYRPHRSTSKHPIVFLHGIGIGLWPYRAFLKELISRNPDVGILAFEILPISMHISAPLPSREAMCRTIERSLASRGIHDFAIVAHSYGTALATHMLHDPQLASRIAATFLIDPIPFLLHHPSVAYNFLYRTPAHANEWQLWYFASRDPDIARVLGRHFHWFDSILFRDEILGKRAAVSLAGRDQIVDGHAVRKYLTESDEAQAHWSQDELEVLFFPEADHATVFDSAQSRQLLLRALDRLIKH